MDLLFRPFLLACATKTSKVIVLALGAVQKLLAIDAASAEILSSVIGTLRIQAESDDETVQLKILQTLLLAIGSPSALERVEESALSQALGLCFRLHAGKSPIIANTATATLRQVCSAHREHPETIYKPRMSFAFNCFFELICLSRS